MSVTTEVKSSMQMLMISAVLSALGIIPVVGGLLALVGFVFMVIALNKLKREYEEFNQSFTMVIGMLILVVVTFVLGIIGGAAMLLTGSGGLLSIVLTVVSIASVILGFLLFYNNCMGSDKVASNAGISATPNGDLCWKIYAVASALNLLGLFINIFSTIGGLAIIVGSIAFAYYLFQLNNQLIAA